MSNERFELCSYSEQPGVTNFVECQQSAAELSGMTSEKD
jgi:hypothetical protein